MQNAASRIEVPFAAIAGVKFKSSRKVPVSAEARLYLCPG